MQAIATSSQSSPWAELPYAMLERQAHRLAVRSALPVRTDVKAGLWSRVRRFLEEGGPLWWSAFLVGLTVAIFAIYFLSPIPVFA